MWERNDGNIVQAPEGAIISDKEEKGDFSRNKTLIAIAQKDGGESEESMAATAELIENNRGLVRKIALRFKDRGVDTEDLLQIGTIGIIKAIRTFDDSRGTCFSTYAVPLIFGEIRRHLRDEGPIKVGRYYKRLGAMLMNEKNRIMTEEGREPRLGELSELVGVSREEAAMALDAASPIASLSDSAYGDEDGVELEETIADEYTSGEAARFIDSLAISQLIASLPPLWRQIITFRYYRGMTQTQVASVLGITQVKVSREEKKILEHMRERMTQ